jgi:hypothetical protein
MQSDTTPKDTFINDKANGLSENEICSQNIISYLYTSYTPKNLRSAEIDKLDAFLDANYLTMDKM